MPKPIAAGRSLGVALVCAWCCHGVAHAEGARQAKVASVAPESSRTLRLLRTADADRDARVSLVELKRFLERQVRLQVDRRLLKLDRNGDGRVTEDEVPTMSSARFARFDLDGDGAFTASELAGVMRAQALARCDGILVSLDMDRDGALTASDVADDATRVARRERNTGEARATAP